MTHRIPLSYVQLDIAKFRHGRIVEASLGAQGVWMNLLVLAHETGDITAVDARPTYLARQLGQPWGVLEPLVDELVELGSLFYEGDRLHIYGTESAHEDLLHKRSQGAERQRRYAERQKTGVPTAAEAAAAPPAPAGTPTAAEISKTVAQACDGTDGTVGEYLAVLELGLEVADRAEQAGQATPKLRGNIENTVVAHAARRFFEDRITTEQLPPLFRTAKQIGTAHVIWALVECAGRALDEGSEVKYVIKVARSHAEGLS
jgi:hypothetical protein